LRKYKEIVAASQPSAAEEETPQKPRAQQSEKPSEGSATKESKKKRKLTTKAAENGKSSKKSRAEPKPKEGAEPEVQPEEIKKELNTEGEDVELPSSEPPSNSEKKRRAGLPKRRSATAAVEAAAEPDAATLSDGHSKASKSKQQKGRKSKKAQDSDAAEENENSPSKAEATNAKLGEKAEPQAAEETTDFKEQDSVQRTTDVAGTDADRKERGHKMRRVTSKTKDTKRSD